MSKYIIDIASILGRNLKSRIAVRRFYDYILSTNKAEVILDFKNVSFATRSFMDEFYNILLCNTVFSTNIINLSSDLNKMLEAVKSTQQKKAKSAKIISRRSEMRFTSISQVNKYLEGLSFS
jgi:hypothetical protein